MLKRRSIVVLSAAAAAAGVWPATAQQRTLPRIGFLFHGSPENARELVAFRDGLKEHGYVDGQTVLVEYRFARGEIDALPKLAHELVALKVDVIVTPTTPAAIAAQRATSTIPIVFAAVADAVGRAS